RKTGKGEREMERQRERETEMKREREGETERDRDGERERERERETERERWRDRERGRERGRERDMKREREGARIFRCPFLLLTQQSIILSSKGQRLSARLGGQRGQALTFTHYQHISICILRPENSTARHHTSPSLDVSRPASFDLIPLHCLLGGVIES